MTDLVDEVKACFDKTREAQDDGRGPLQIINEGDEELCPGFDAMRHHYGERLQVTARRGYHHFAGAALPSNSDQLLVQTGGEFMLPATIAISLAAFSDGVLIGHQENHIVRMCYFFQTLEHLFHDDDFLEAAADMAKGFTNDPEVYEFFEKYVTGGLTHVAHITGFAHQEEVNTAKVWDIWLMTGTATTAASYLAGYRLGDAWRERDVLDGIQIATEGDPDGSEGEG
jgi:hypothetical protein